MSIKIKKVLVIGSHSYIGTSFSDFIRRYFIDFQVDMMSVRNNDWEKLNFSKYEVVLYLAAIVHQSAKKNSYQHYLTINSQLMLKIANKAKQEGSAQFIYMSTISVYGLNGSFNGWNSRIDSATDFHPITDYGKSKLHGEIRLNSLQSDAFTVTIIRPPMVYGPNCPGNYRRLRSVSLKLPVVPAFKNQRSMIFIDNLSLFLVYAIKKKLSGAYLPANVEAISTSELMRHIRSAHGKKTRFIYGFNPLILVSGKFIVSVKKLFGTLTISPDQRLAEYYRQQVKFSESINDTERGFK